MRNIIEIFVIIIGFILIAATAANFWYHLKDRHYSLIPLNEIEVIHRDRHVFNSCARPLGQLQAHLDCWRGKG